MNKSSTKGIRNNKGKTHEGINISTPKLGENVQAIHRRLRHKIRSSTHSR
jgi:hypothetical protein